MLWTDHIRLDPAYRAALEAAGLARVPDVLARVDGKVVAWSRTTETTHIPGLNGEPGFYLKRYFYPTWKKRVRGAFRGTFFGVHRGLAEFRALRNMRALGISAVRPVGYGTRRCGHFVTACFLITEEVPAACNLTTFAQRVAAGQVPLSPADRWALIARLAEQVAGMHAAGFSHGQLFWRNVLLRTSLAGEPEFFFLDAQPRRWRQLRTTSKWWLYELAHLTVSALPFTRRSDRLRFLLHYSQVARLTPELRDSARRVAALTRHWQQHETQRIKMNQLFDQWNDQLERDAPPVTPAPDGAAALSCSGAGTRP
jgi:hypothetical protein